MRELTVVEESRTVPAPTPVEIGGVRAGPPRSVVLRRDNWRLQPIAVALGLLGFIAYSTWAAFRNNFYYAGNVGRDYLSPLYSPCVTDNCHGYVWGPITGSWWAVSPALIILIFPLGFRLTCYYYRKAYYRSFWLSPPACAVADAGSTTPGGLRARYSGETRFPLILQNLHRYFFYIAVGFAAVLTWDAIASFRFSNGVGVALGSLILTVNAVLIWAVHARLPRLPAPVRRRAGTAVARRRCASGSGRTSPAGSIPTTSSTRGCRSSGSPSPTSTSGSSPRARSTTRGFL